MINPAAAAVAKSLQSYLTLCDPTDGSPPGSPIPGILQARTLEWVATSFSNTWKWKVKVKLLIRVWLLAIPRTAAYQAPPPMGFSRQDYWSGMPLPSPMIIPLSLIRKASLALNSPNFLFFRHLGMRLVDKSHWPTFLRRVSNYWLLLHELRSVVTVHGSDLEPRIYVTWRSLELSYFPIPEQKIHHPFCEEDVGKALKVQMPQCSQPPFSLKE